jgi:RNA polymerase sporulation-specific sigma factor
MTGGYSGALWDEQSGRVSPCVSGFSQPMTTWTIEDRELEQAADADLVRLVRGGHDRALSALLLRYRKFARSKARTYFLAGADREDVVQEGMIGLYKAIRDFDLDGSTPFRAFAELCISRQILTAIKTANRHKHQPLNSSVSLDAPAHSGSHGERSIGEELVASNESDPAEIMVSAEHLEELRASLQRDLTDLESNVLRLYIQGKSYDEIAGTLGNHVKSIDNALQRIKRKLQRHIEERNAEPS